MMLSHWAISTSRLKSSLRIRAYQLLRLQLDPEAALVPEISGNRLMISIRMLHKADNGQMVLTQQDGQHEMVLCA